MKPFDSISVQWLSEYSKPLQQFSDSTRRPLKLMSEPKRTLKQTIDAVTLKGLLPPTFKLLSQFKQEDRDRLLELALQAQPFFEEQVPVEDVPDFTEEQSLQLNQWFPSLSNRLAKEKGLIIQIIVAFLFGLISNLPQHLDAVRAHQDAVQAHQDFLDSRKYAQPVQTNIPSASAKRK